MHPAAFSEEKLLRQCEVGRGRASGPGGQHRNKVETAVVITHTPTGVSAQASERRSQIDNKRIALKRLRLNLAVQHREPAREKPSELWESRRKGTKIACNPGHRDYPALLAEALDVIAQAEWRPKPAAEAWGVSSTQLVRLVADHPPALAKWNQERAAVGLRPLRA